MEEVEEKRRTNQASRGSMKYLHKERWEPIHNGPLTRLHIFLSMQKLQGPDLDTNSVTNSENKKKNTAQECTMGPYTAPGIALYKLLTFAIKGEEMYRKMIPTNMEIYMYKVFQCSIVFIVCNLLHPFTWRSC